MICQILNLLQKIDQLSCDLVILVKKGYLILSWPFREKTTGRPSKLQQWTGTLVRSSSRSTVTTCHCINHVTKDPTPSLDKDSEMESKACVANKFSILGFETSFTLNWSYIFSVNFCYKVRTVFFFGLILRKSTLFLRRGNKNTIVSVLRHFTCELCPCELYPVILTCERYTFISRLSSPSSLATSAPWKQKWKRRRNEKRATLCYGQPWMSTGCLIFQISFWPSWAQHYFP